MISASDEDLVAKGVVVGQPGLVDDVARAIQLIESLAPGSAPVPIRTPLQTDECRHFLRAVEEEVFEFFTCPDTCPRAKKYGVDGPDHFVTPDGKARHLFSDPTAPTAWLSREYIPHIAAYAVCILDYGFSKQRSSFSRYRKFTRDLLRKKAGGSYETDAEFFNNDGSIFLQIEAKASERETRTLARSIEEHGLDVTEAAKEVEYVLDLAPAYLWVVGPGSLDPPAFIYEVTVTGPTTATFSPQAVLPFAN